MLVQRPTSILNSTYHYIAADGNSFKKLIEPIEKKEILSNELANFVYDTTNFDNTNNSLSWRELQDFYALPEIKHFSNEDMILIKEKIKLHDSEGLINLVDSLLEKYKINKAIINSNLADSEYIDLDSLLCEIINKIPKVDYGLHACINKDVNYFENKTMQICDPIDLETYFGTIVKCKKIGGRLKLEMIDKSIVVITKNNKAFNIAHKKRISYSFTAGIMNFLKEGENFLIDVSNNFVSNDEIKTGEYILKKSTLKNNIVGKLIDSKINQKFEIVNIDDNTIRYIIKISSKNDKIEKLEIKKCEDNDKEIVCEAISYHESGSSNTSNYINDPININLLYKVIKYDTIIYKGINMSNYGRQIQIKEDTDDSKKKLYYLNEIKEKTEEIRDHLIKSVCDNLLAKLIDDLIKNKLEKLIDISILDASIKEKIIHISKLYFDNLKQAKSLEEILKEIVIETNYAKLVQRANNISVAKTMELLGKGFKHIEKIEDKDVVIFMGNTGSGKSTAMCYLLGHPLKKNENKVGETVIQMEKEWDDSKPKIGQSLAESETLFVKGFEIMKTINSKLTNDILFCDCPGFGDTRGIETELSINLTIDRTVKSCKTLKALVLVVPIHAFVMDRANPIFQLILSIQERFCNTFDPDHQIESSNIFILVTKCDQVKQEVKEGLGSRICEICSEIQRSLNKLLLSASEDQKSIQIQLERRAKIWNSLQKMYEHNQIHFFEYRNQKSRNDILRAYIGTNGCLNKERYKSVMNSFSLKKTFEDYLEMSIDAWKFIYTKYFREIPELIIKTNNEIISFQRKTEEATKEIRELNEHLESLNKNEENLHKAINTLASYQSSSVAVSDIDLKNELEAIQTKTDQREAIKKQISLNDDIIAKANKNILNLEKEINQIKSKSDKMIKEQADLEMEIIKLKEGSREVILHENKYSITDKLPLFNFDLETRKNAFNEVRNFKENEMQNTRTVNVTDIKKKVYYLAEIEKEYRLVPHDPNERKKFEQNFMQETGGEYVAKVEGYGYEFDLGVNAHPEGRKLVYGYKLDFSDPSKLPWIKISHVIPNHSYYKSRIDINDSKVQILYKEISALQIELHGTDSFKGKLAELQENNSLIVDLEAQNKQHKTSIDIAIKYNIGELLKQKNEELIKIKLLQNETTEHIKQIEITIEDIEHKIVEETKKLQGIRLNKRNFAIIVYLNRDVVKLLCELAKIILTDNVQDRGYNLTNVTNDCNEFLKLYEEFSKYASNHCEKDLFNDNA